MYKYTEPHLEVHVVGIGGTLRESSTSRWALERALAAAEGEGATTTLKLRFELSHHSGIGP